MRVTEHKKTPFLLIQNAAQAKHPSVNLHNTGHGKAAKKKKIVCASVGKSDKTTDDDLSRSTKLKNTFCLSVEKQYIVTMIRFAIRYQ